jgi:hypothetical protein
MLQLVVGLKTGRHLNHMPIPVWKAHVKALSDRVNLELTQ